MYFSNQRVGEIFIKYNPNIFIQQELQRRKNAYWNAKFKPKPSKTHKKKKKIIDEEEADNNKPDFSQTPHIGTVSL